MITEVDRSVNALRSSSSWCGQCMATPAPISSIRTESPPATELGACDLTHRIDRPLAPVGGDREAPASRPRAIRSATTVGGIVLPIR